MTDANKTLEKLTKRSEFLACAQAPFFAKGAVVVQARHRLVLVDPAAIALVEQRADDRTGNSADLGITLGILDGYGARARCGR